MVASMLGLARGATAASRPCVASQSCRATGVGVGEWGGWGVGGGVGGGGWGAEGRWVARRTSSQVLKW